jgi:methyl-accepting chemotaxis protein
MRWTVGRRLAAIGTLSIVTTMVVGGIGLVQSSDASKRADHAFLVNRALSNTIDAQHSASVVLADVSILTSSLPEARRAEIVDQMTEHAGELDGQLAALQQIRLDARYATFLTTFVPAITAVLNDADEIARTSGALPPAAFDEVQRHWDAFDEQSDGIKTALTKVSATEIAETQSDADTNINNFAFTTLLAAVAVGVATWLVARTIARPIRATKALLERVAGGDFTGRVTGHSSDDLGAMAGALNSTVERVGAAIHRISEEAATLTASAQQLTGVSGQVAAGAQQVAT